MNVTEDADFEANLWRCVCERFGGRGADRPIENGRRCTHVASEYEWGKDIEGKTHTFN